MRRRSTGVLVVLLGACTAQISGSGVAGHWELVADETGGLVDVRHPELGAYPNARGSDRLAVRLMVDGRLCASDGATDFCGGPLDGIPYTTRALVDGGQMCLRVVDLYGNEVERSCRRSLPAEIRVDAEPSCWSAFTAAGGACEVCADADGNLLSNTCGGSAPAASTGSEAAGAPEGPDPDAVPGQTARPEAPACAGGDGAVLAGAVLVVEVINEGLERMEIGGRLTPPASTDELAGYDPTEIALAGGVTCDAVRAESQRRFGGDGPGDDDYVFGTAAIRECLRGGECRIGQLVSRSMADACDRIEPGCDVDNVSLGIITGGGLAVGELCGPHRPDEIDECRGSPLVVDLAGDGLALVGRDAGVRFPLMGGEPTAVGWLRGDGDDALVAIDRDGDGAIRSGSELFGEVTGGWAPHGFAALGRLDADGDGWVDARDPDYARIVLWQDDGDGQSAPAELLGLPEAGIAALPVHAQVLGARDSWGNELGLVAAARGASGRSLPMFDVWFTFGDDRR